MKRNTQLIIILFIVLLGGNINSFAVQTQPYKGNISINPVKLEQEGKFLYVEVDVTLNGVQVNSAQSVDLIPQLVSEDNAHTLPIISLKGGTAHRVYERKLSLMSKKEKAEYQKPYVVEKLSKLNNQTIEYRHMLPYEKWMENAHLKIQYDVCGCGNTDSFYTQDIINKVTLEQIPVPYTVVPHMAYIQPQAEKVKQREIQMETFLDFEVNKVYIRTEYMNNPRELAKIRNMIDDLKNDASIEVKGLDIIGFASPEGTLAGNKRLSEGRAKALRDYLASHYEFPRNIYHIEFGGENWKGLEEALTSYEIEYKSEVLDILQNTPDSEQRKTKLKNLRGGAPYRDMLRNIYPDLRVAICKVAYNIKNFDIKEAKEIIKNRPQNLSLNEMFLVANSYEAGSQEFIDIFETAVRMYPKDDVANLNAAAAALMRNDLVSAKRYIEKADSNKYPSEYNNIEGMIALLDGDFDRAQNHLNIAAKNGLEAAKLNLKELANRQQSLRK